MSRGNKLRIFVCLMVIAFVVSIEYKTIYQVVVASPLVQTIVGDSVSDNTVQQDGNSSEGTEELPGSESVEVTIEDETEEETGNETEGNVNEGTSIDFYEQEEEIPFENEDETDTQSNGSSDESVSNEETGIFSVNPEESLSENTIAEELENVSAAYGESAIPTTLVFGKTPANCSLCFSTSSIALFTTSPREFIICPSEFFISADAMFSGRLTK